MPPFRPPDTVARNAERALKVREAAPPSQRGLTAVGIARARDLGNRERPLTLPVPCKSFPR